MPNPDPPTPTPRRFTLRRASRLSGSAAFAAVFNAKMRKHAGPLAILTKPNALGFHRLGLSVSRKVGNAVKRSRIKRRLREAFRLDRADYAGGYDIVIVVRPHRTALSLNEAQRFLKEALAASHKNWLSRKPQPPPPKTPQAQG